MRILDQQRAVEVASLVALKQKYTRFPSSGAGPEFLPTCAGSLIRRSFHGRAFGDPASGEVWDFHSEEAIEWTSLCAAIDAADKRFTMVDLGAGYGRWSVAAASV